ncbi:class I SAM-dependent methyltransferase [Methylobrevis pamukkalensis]|uniref:16S ribosomal RNA methyltransferase KsgA/Dim1 family protein n=1 Tax=Methylobrevis pamukkalensis TaxID=1439726 RepID=A0A1E3GX50_9HYPH|nr:rRNA adenine N-6-methyltransferase family protein [Methylobrevis pamukkalensis]ODN68525.1 16S ribosomal RNA methyltransferase KsgA/Dim1 family protein [Methylobrevis pamukkalensis]
MIRCTVHRRRDPTPGTAGDHLRFARSWLQAPLRVAAIAPSGRSLARLITRDITPASGPILELGPGTGVFTAALLDRGIDETDLTLVEMDAAFASLLRARFPRAGVVEADAARLDPSALFPGTKAGATISGLGLLSMRPRTVIAILKGAIACMRPDGALFQFTYGPTCPVPPAILARLGLKANRTGGTWANLPPASVYRIERDPTISRSPLTGPATGAPK